jgi:AcrR family transcriptional regulator
MTQKWVLENEMAQQSNRDYATAKGGRRHRPSAAKAKRQEPPSDRVEEFLTAALDLFAERNFATVTIKDIAKSLNVHSALIYYYFKNKTDLFRATIEYAVANAFENVRALENKSAAAPDLITAWLENHVNKYAEIHRFVKIALDFRSAHEGDPNIAAAIERFYEEERRMLSKVVRQGVKQ